MNETSLPVVVIGGGPVGLAAAAHLLARGLQPLVLEAGPEIGHAVRAWGHVRMFSPWRYNIDAAARSLLEREGWSAPDGKAYPTGVELIDQYLAPLAATKALGRHVRTNARVVGIARRDHSRLQHGVPGRAVPHMNGAIRQPYPPVRRESLDARTSVTNVRKRTHLSASCAHGRRQ